MRKLHFLFLLATLLPSSSFAMDPSIVHIDAALYSGANCTDYLTPKKPSTQTLVSHEIPSGSLIISSSSSFPTTTLLEQRFLTEFAKLGLNQIVADKALSGILLDHLVRLGFVEQDAKDKFYVPFKLVNENQQVRLDQKHADPIVQKYLRLNQFAKKAKIKGEEPVLNAISNEYRKSTLYWQTLRALEVIPDEDKSSRDALHAAFVEVGRLNNRGQLTAKSLSLVLNSLHAFAVFVPKKLELWGPLESVLPEIPGGTIIAGALMGTIKAINYFSLTNRGLRTSVHEVGTQNRYTEMVSGSLKVAFFNHDPFEFTSKARSFAEKYVVGKAPIFSPEFVKDLQAAYPEIDLLLNNTKRFTTLNGVAGGYIENGSFGPGSYDTYKVLNRIAVTVSLMRGDRNLFPLFSDAEFSMMRNNFLQAIGLTKFNFESADEFLTFLAVDVVGRVQDDFIEQLDKSFGITGQVGEADYERRAHVILEKYRLTSYSFSRLSTEQKQDVLDLFKLIYEYNAGQVIQLEAGPASLNVLRNASSHQLAFLFYRSILSYAGLPDQNGQPIAHGISSQMLGRWSGLKRAILALGDPNFSVKDAYNSYVNFVADNLSMKFENADDLVLVRLTAMSRATTAKDIEDVKKGFSELAASYPDEAALITKYLSGERSVLVYDSSTLISYVKRNKKSNFEAYRALAAVYSALERTPALRDRLGQQKHTDGEVRVRIRPLLDFLIVAEDDTVLMNQLGVESLGQDFVVVPK